MTRILIVEDSATQAERLRAVLEEAGYEVVLAYDAEAALAKLDSSLDMVISDIMMPGLSGYELCKRIKTSVYGRNLPVMLLSTLSDPMDIISGLECGADNFVTKPYHPDQLLERVTTVLESRRVRASGKLRVGVEVVFLGRSFTINSDKEQIIDLLMSTFEDIVRTNRELHKNRAELAVAKLEIEDYAQSLELRVEERTRELATQQRILAQAQKMAQVGNWRVRLDTNAYEWSDQMYEIHGVPRDFVPSYKTIAAMVHEEDRLHVLSLMQGVLETRKPCRMEYRVLRPNGDVRFCWGEGFFESGEDGDALVGYCQDITERKTIAQQLHQAQKMEVVGQLTGGIAHDFNNMLTVIISNLDLLLGSAALEADTRESADAALNASLRAAELTRQLLAFSRKQNLERRVIDPNALVERTVAMLRRAIAGDIAISTKLGETVCLADSDASQLESAITNLVVNARDAMPKGGTITVETANVVLDEAYATANADVAAGEYVMIAVSDTGTGIPASLRARVFEPFFTTKEVGKGTGLGLSMVYGFMKQTGGHVKIYSEEGRGTVVRLYLPRSGQDAVKSVGADISPLAPGGNARILVVEDDEAVRRAAVLQLRELGYRVNEAANANEALALLEHEAIDLLFSDVTMPGGLSGHELATIAIEKNPALCVLLTSGFTEPFLRNGETATEFALLGKPYRRQELAERIQQALQVPIK